MEILLLLILGGFAFWALSSFRNAGHPEDPERPCGICNRPSHEAWLKRGMHCCGRRRCLVQTHVRATGTQIPDAAVFLNQLYKFGTLTFHRGRCIPTVKWDLVQELDPLDERGSTSGTPTSTTTARDTPSTNSPEAFDFDNTVRRILAIRQIPLEGPHDHETPFRQVVTLAAWIGAEAVSRSEAKPDALDDDDRFVAMLIAFVASDHLSRLAEVEFEIASVLACISLNTTLGGGFVPDAIGQLISTHNGMAQNPRQAKVLQAIGGQIASFFSTNQDEHLARLGKLFSIVRAGLQPAA